MCDRDRGWLLDELLKRVEALEGKKAKPDEGGVWMTREQARQLDWAVTKPEWWSTIREVAAEIHKRAEDCYAGDGLGTVVQLGTLYQWGKRLFEALGLKPHLPEGEQDCARSAQSAQSPGNVTGHHGKPEPLEWTFHQGDAVMVQKHGEETGQFCILQCRQTCMARPAWHALWATKKGAIQRTWAYERDMTLVWSPKG